MCDNKNNLNTGVSFLAGAVIGALVGAAAAVMLNPTTGPETRKKMSDSAKKYAVKGGDFAESAKDLADRVKTTAEPYIKEVKQKAAPYVKTALSNIRETTQMQDFGLDSNVETEQIDMLVDTREEDAPKTRKPTTKNRKYFKKTS